jgi:hypothetical protein
MVGNGVDNKNIYLQIVLSLWITIKITYKAKIMLFRPRSILIPPLEGGGN